MNIIVRTHTGSCIVRPDTTWEKDNEDFFPPDFVRALLFTPVLFAHVSKPGRSVGLRFSQRYYDSVNCGILLYPGNMLAGNEEDFACASCIDHTSFLPAPMFDRSCLENSSGSFRLLRNGKEIFSAEKTDASEIEKAIEKASERIYIRIGDLIAVELAQRQPLWSVPDGPVNISGTFCGQEILDFNIR